MKRYRRLGAALLCCALALSGCGAPASTPQEEKVVLTVLVDTTLNNIGLYWAKLAAQFPDIKLDITTQATLAPEEEIARRVAHGDVADLVFSVNLTAGLPGMSECFLDLSGKPYINRYQTSYLNSLDVDGRLYCLPANLAVQGIVYNKTLFDELDLTFPRNYGEFETVCGRLRAAGYRPGVLAVGDQGPAKLFARCYAAASPHSLEAWKWAREFNAGEAPVQASDLAPALNLLEAYEGLGFLIPEDLTTNRWKFRHMLADRAAPMVLGEASTLWRYSSTDTFRLMPFFNPADGEGYFFLYPLISLAVGKQVAEDPRKEAAVDRVLDYITSEEGQQDLMKLDKGIFSPILGMQEIGELDFYQDVKGRLTDETLLTVTEFPQCVDALYDGLMDCLWGGRGREALAEAMEAASQGARGKSRETLATAEQDFTLSETNALALDAMREALGTQIAIIRQRSKTANPDNFFLCGTLYAGPVTETDLMCIHPLVEDPQTSYPMIRVEMTGAQLLELLSYEGAYYYSGVTVRYRRDEALGLQRADALLDADGRELGAEERLTVAMLRQSRLREDQYISLEESGVPLWTALADYMRARGTLTPFAPNPAVYE